MEKSYLHFQQTNEKFTILVNYKNERKTSSLVIQKTNHDMFHLNFDGFNFYFEMYNVLHYLHAIQRCITEDYRTYSQRVDVICSIFPCTNVHIFHNKTLIRQMFCIWNSHLIKQEQQRIQFLTNEGKCE